MEKKYFFFDIDGTLLAGTPGNQVYPDSARWALKELEKNGHFVAIATGRSHAMAKDWLGQFDVHNMVSDGGNGLLIRDELIELKPLDYEKCCALVNECIDKGFIWGINPDDEGRRLTPDERFEQFTHDVYMKTEVLPGLKVEDYSNIFKVYIACYPGEEQVLQTLDALPWVRFHHEYLFVEPADKSRGIIKMVEHEGGDIRDVVVFGDQRNDLSMFDKRWTSIAMGNGIQELKDRADYVTDDVDKDGIYKALVHYGWIEPNPEFED